MNKTEENVKQHIFLASPHMSAQGFEQEYIKEAFDTNWIAPLGKNVDGFEREMAEYLGSKNAVALTSGTAAIHLALKLVGVSNDDIVFCQSLTFSATVNPIIYQNAFPVFIDSDYETWNMSPKALERAFEKYEKLGKKPKAVILVHLYGLAANLDEIVSICHKYNVPLIEDAAESLGTIYNGKITNGKSKYTGTFGDYGIISFNGNKIITSSGGGMLLCNTDDADKHAAKARFWATQARDAARHYQHTEIGYNYRMSNIVAGIGRGQLKVLHERIEKKKYIYEYYKNVLGDLDGISLMPMNDWADSNCWLSVIQLSDNCKVNPMDIILALEEDDIESRPVWKPLHLQPIFEKYDFIAIDEKGELKDKSKFVEINIHNGADDSIAGNIFNRGVCLPSDTKMLDEDLDRICKVIKKLWE